jgi:hypothetical protein
MAQNISFQSNLSRKSSISHGNIKKKQKIEPYISPFIKNAKRTAAERAREAMKILKSQKNVVVYNEWDQNTRAPGYFDPDLKKQEIFRLEPRKPPKQPKHFQDEEELDRPPTAVMRPITTSPSSVARVDVIQRRTHGEDERVTMRTTGVAPTRNPLRSHHHQHHREVKITSFLLFLDVCKSLSFS